jgi:hypothetical protein
VVERSKLSESDTCDFVKAKVVFEEDMLFLESQMLHLFMLLV